MIGYHYTSYKIYESIKKKGLLPMPIIQEELEEIFDLWPSGVWLWTEELSEQSELGMLIELLARGGNLKIVKLQVEYDKKDKLTYSGNGFERSLVFTPSIVFNDWHCNIDNPEAIIIKNKIDPKNIKLARVFNLLDIVR